MNRPIALGTLVLASVGTWLVLSPDQRRRIKAGVKRRLTQRMEHMLAGLPEESPPKLIMTILPQLREQNEEIIATLREQNALLRDQQAQEH